MNSLFERVADSLTTISDNRNEISALAATTLFIGGPIAAWSLLDTWPAVTVTFASVIGAIFTGPISTNLSPSKKWLSPIGGVAFGSMIALGPMAMFNNDVRENDPASAPSIITATMNEVCTQPGEKLLIRVPTPKAQRIALAENGLSHSVGPSYAQHAVPDTMGQWTQPYVPRTKEHNPFYTVQLTHNFQGEAKDVKDLKSYVVTVDKNDPALYNVAYSYKSWWRGKNVEVNEKHTSAARPEACATDAKPTALAK